MATNIDGGDSAVPVLLDKEGDVTRVVEDRGNVHAQVPGDDGGCAVKAHEGADMARDNEGDDDVTIPIGDGGGTVHVRTKVDEGDVMDKQVDNGGDVQDLLPRMVMSAPKSLLMKEVELTQ